MVHLADFCDDYNDYIPRRGNSRPLTRGQGAYNSRERRTKPLAHARMRNVNDARLSMRAKHAV